MLLCTVVVEPLGEVTLSVVVVVVTTPTVVSAVPVVDPVLRKQFYIFNTNRILTLNIKLSHISHIA